MAVELWNLRTRPWGIYALRMPLEHPSFMLYAIQSTGVHVSALSAVRWQLGAQAMTHGSHLTGGSMLRRAPLGKRMLRQNLCRSGHESVLVMGHGPGRHVKLKALQMCPMSPCVGAPSQR